MLGLFRSADSSSPSPTVSLIDAETTITGDAIVGAGDLRIEGTVHANVERDGRVVIAPNGTVHGTVRAQSILVQGFARGELRAEDDLVLSSSSTVRAHLQTDALTIEPGADFRGTVHDTSEMSDIRTPLPSPGTPSFSPPPLLPAENATPNRRAPRRASA